MKKLYAVILLGFSVFLTAPSDGFSQHRGGGGHGDHGGYSGGGHGGYPGGGYGGYRDGGHGGYRGGDHGGYPGGGYYGGHRSQYGGYYGGRHNDNFFWGATGFLFGTALGAAIYQPPVYRYGPPVYYSQPRMCRYERYMTDQWGQTYLEYFAAPCR